MTVVFMSHPTAVLLQYLQKNSLEGKGDAFRMGQIAMGLEILTQMKILDSLPMTDLTIQLVGAFQALLVDTGMADEAEKWYERLDAWRAPRFIPAGKPTDRAFGASSSAAAPEGELRRTRRLRASLPERHDLDDATIAYREGLSDESDSATQTE